ncbi:spore germination protein [Bacillus pumilus]|uniref:spore germination protein n=1 Tax=Bacillus pumilus TaxID=1408 RepID=UPI000D036F31|nr:spore germination protein [Bacillus pumilus]PRS28736.1 spore germination protein [Bacillus pumilus]
MNQTPLKEHLYDNLSVILPQLKEMDDLVHEKKTLPHGQVVYYLYIKEMNEIMHIQTFLKVLLQDHTSLTKEKLESNLSMMTTRSVKTFEEIIDAIFQGHCVVLINGFQHAYILETKGTKKRSLGDSTSETVVRGPKVGFIEDLNTNLALVRQRLKNPDLKTVNMKIGEKKYTQVTIMYIDGIVETSVLKEVKKRLKQVTIDDIQDSGVLEELIEDNVYSPFPQIQNTERPDKVASALNNGRVAIFVDHSPFVLIVPASLATIMQSPDDYYERWIAASLIRMLRFTSIFLTLFLSAIYIALVSFHQGLLPTTLAISISSTRENVPFPPIVEALIMEMTIELLREAGLRLPNPLGQTIGLVGGVVIGQAAVQAHIVSSIMVIIVSVMALASFTVPQYGMGMSFRVLRFVSMFAAATFGLYGIVLFMLVLLTHLTRQKSFGTPYFSPDFVFSYKNEDNSIIRLPLRNQQKGERDGQS